MSYFQRIRSRYFLVFGHARAIVSFPFDMETMRLSKRRLIEIFIWGEDQMRILRNAVPK